MDISTPGAAAPFDDGTFLLAGSFGGTTEFLVDEDEWESVTANGSADGYLLHVCP